MEGTLPDPQQSARGVRILRGLAGVLQTQMFLCLAADWVFWGSFPEGRPVLRP